MYIGSGGLKLVVQTIEQLCSLLSKGIILRTLLSCSFFHQHQEYIKAYNYLNFLHYHNSVLSLWVDTQNLLGITMVRAGITSQEFD